MNYKKLFFVIAFTSLCNVLYAQQIIRVSDVLNKGYIGQKTATFQDVTSTLPLTQIIRRADLFKPSLAQVPNLGISAYTNWVKFDLLNDSEQNVVTLTITNPIIDQVTLYIVRKGSTDSISMNNYTPIRKRAYNHQHYLFDLKLARNERVTCYLKLTGKQQILAPIELNTYKKTISDISTTDTQNGIYLGIMMVMLLYNLFVYMSVKDNDYLVYCHYIFWVALTQATLLGFSHRFLWTNSTWLAQHMITLCGAMSGIATILFAQVFLRTRSFVPKLHWALTAAIVAYTAAIIVLIGFSRLAAFQMVNVSALFGSVLVVAAAWRVYQKNYKPATYFLIGWSIFFASVFVFVFKDYNILPYNSLTIHAIEIGSALEAVFLSFALAGKINILKKEKEVSQALALKSAEENQRIVSEQNVMLEAKVRERTTELIASNDELHKTLVDLKEAESQLVESEKMASLGQLTAGIAHEINNPVNFITGNINPLKRDVDILLGALHTIENVGLSEALTEEKQRQIDLYKEEIDFDYLKLEISHLLKGINEGASRTAEIVKGLRIFSRLDEDDLKLANINEGLDSTLIIINNMLDNKIRVVKNYAGIPLIECYPGKLNQVFLNIISNAIYAIKKQHPKGGGVLTISTLSEQGSVLIKIEDNGTGMDEQTKKKIFEPFFTTKEVGEGTGLGMSIVYNTIRKHNGTILIDSEPGRGTEFSIELPKKHDISGSGQS